jgi:uncharacterized ion transporter superfamily protein YfcC
MPLFAPLGDLAGISRSLVITTWCMGWGLIGLVAPTSAVVMGGVALGRIGYEKFVRFAAPMLGIMFVITAAILVLAARLG